MGAQRWGVLLGDVTRSAERIERGGFQLGAHRFEVLVGFTESLGEFLGIQTQPTAHCFLRVDRDFQFRQKVSGVREREGGRDRENTFKATNWFSVSSSSSTGRDLS